MNLAERICAASLIKGQFRLRSGIVSDTYFDKYQFEADPELLLAIADSMMTSLLLPETEVLAGLEMGAIPIVTMLSQVTGLPCAFIRKQAKEYGTCRYVEGASLIGKKFVLVEDVVTSGGAVIDAVKKLATDGLTPSGVICVINRQSQLTSRMADVLKEHNVPYFGQLLGLEDLEKVA